MNHGSSITALCWMACMFLRTLVILVIALLVWWLTRLPEPLIALAAIIVWVGCNAFKDVKDWLKG